MALTGADFSATGGCSDVLAWTSNPANTMALLVSWPGAAAAAQGEGGHEAAVDLPDAEVTVTLQLGRGISAGYCTDIIMPNEPRIDAEAVASAGRARITVVPDGNDPLFPTGTATVVLTDLVFEIDAVEGPELWHVTDVEIRDVFVGWMPG